MHIQKVADALIAFLFLSESLCHFPVLLSLVDMARAALPGEGIVEPVTLCRHLGEFLASALVVCLLGLEAGAYLEFGGGQIRLFGQLANQPLAEFAETLGDVVHLYPKLALVLFLALVGREQDESHDESRHRRRIGAETENVSPFEEINNSKQSEYTTPEEQETDDYSGNDDFQGG